MKEKIRKEVDLFLENELDSLQILEIFYSLFGVIAIVIYSIIYSIKFGGFKKFVKWSYSPKSIPRRICDGFILFGIVFTLSIFCTQVTLHLVELKKERELDNDDYEDEDDLIDHAPWME